MTEKRKDLLTTIKSKVDDAQFAELQRIVDKNILALGTDEAFALRDNDGEIRAYKQRVRLSVEENTLVKIGKKKAGNNWIDNCVISAQGYEVLNEATGTCVIMPKDVLVNGNLSKNPFVERDESNGRILAVYARAVAFRFSSKGLPQVCDWTTVFDTPSYRMIDLLAKAKKLPQAFRLLPNEMSPTEEDGATWAKYPFDESTSLWINTSHEEALTWFSEIINREKKAMDFAQTFARRNASKHLHGLQQAPGPVWDVPVLCWRPTSGNIVKWDATQYFELQDRVGGMISAPSKEFKTAPQLTTGKEEVSEENGFKELSEATDPEDRPVIDITPGEQQAESDPEPEHYKNLVDGGRETDNLTPAEEKIMANYNYLRQKFNEEFKEACTFLKLNPETDHTPSQADKIIDRLQETMV